jgi:hypothetical protein
LPDDAHRAGSAHRRKAKPSRQKDHRKLTAVGTRYEVRLTGRIDEAATAALAGLSVIADGGVTVVSGEFDQAGLQGLLELIRMLGLELIDARRVRGTGQGGAGDRAYV